MTNTELVIIIGLVVVAALVAVWVFVSRRRESLRARYGPEYERAIQANGGELRADAELAAREKRVRQYHVRPLDPDRTRYFTEAWRRVQTMFVDNPAAAVVDADVLVTDLMNERGYPMADFDRRADDLSVDHAAVVHHYRDAHAIADRQATQGASTEDLRRAVIHYRALFQDLLATTEPQPVRA